MVSSRHRHPPSVPVHSRSCPRKSPSIHQSQDCLFQDPGVTWEAPSISSGPKHTKILGQKSTPRNPIESALSPPAHPYPEWPLVTPSPGGPAQGGSYRRETATPRGRALHHEPVPPDSYGGERTPPLKTEETYPARRASRRPRVRPGVEKALRARAKDLPSPIDHTSASGQEELRAVARGRQDQRRSQHGMWARAVGHLPRYQLERCPPPKLRQQLYFLASANS